MASLQKIEAKRKKTAKGASAKYLWRMQFDLDGKRPTLRLGLMSEKSAKEVAGHIDHLLECRRHNTGTNEATKAWLCSAEPSLLKKLHAFGLCGIIENPSIANFIKSFIAAKKLKSAERTIVAFKRVEVHLNDYFPGKRLGDITPADAKAFWSYLRNDLKLAENTAKRRFGRARQIFNDALESEAITKNPFKVKSLSVSVGSAVKQYVPRESVQSVIDWLPADKIEWKLLLAFGRFVGCRMPSEIVNLTWDDINWTANTIRLESPKTASSGKPERLVPIFPEVAKLLLSQSETVPPGTVYVFPTLRTHTNTATTASKFVKAAGVVVWDKFWNALRASCETDLMDKYDLRRACAWIGNSPRIAMKHYALLRKSDYLDVGVETKGLTSTKSDVKSDEEQARTVEYDGEETPENPTNPCVNVLEVAGAGLEPARPFLGTGF